jgi:hypothetical protein
MLEFSVLELHIYDSLPFELLQETFFFVNIKHAFDPEM